MDAPLVLWLDDVGRGSVAMVGGKSANLGEMRRFGAPVPDGFAITAVAHARFLEKSGIANEFGIILNEILENENDMAHYERITDAVSQRFEGAAFPADIRDAILAHYEALCAKHGERDLAVAVRSSGVAEDGQEASFAGQFESYLNVRGEQQLIQKTVQCWASQFSVRAMTYRKRKGLAPDGGPMGITVLKMVDARASGVGFTADPLTGDSSRIVLEGSWGLGEGVVQGLVSPDRYVFDKNTLTLLEETIADKEKMVRYAEHGIREDAVPAQKRRCRCVSVAEALRLVELARLLEREYGRPQDFEWAVDSTMVFPDNVFLVQTRPITVCGERSERQKAEYLADLMIHMFRQYRAVS